MIKSKKIRRLVSVVLVLVLATQFVFAASAAEYSVHWYNSDGYEMTATVERRGSSTKEVPYSGTSVYHEEGNTDYFPSGYYTVSYTATWQIDSTYRSYVEDAATQLGLRKSFSRSNIRISANELAVPESAPFGTYYPTINFHGSWALYWVETAENGGQELDSGSISFAPSSCDGYFTSYSMSSVSVVRPAS